MLSTIVINNHYKNEFEDTPSSWRNSEPPPTELTMSTFWKPWHVYIPKLRYIRKPPPLQWLNISKPSRKFKRIQINHDQWTRILMIYGYKYTFQIRSLQLEIRQLPRVPYILYHTITIPFYGQKTSKKPLNNIQEREGALRDFNCDNENSHHE